MADTFAATGSRKHAVARVWLKRGSGKMTVNGRDLAAYFARPTSVMLIEQPLDITGISGQYDIDVRVKGGGLSGQAGAVRLGIARALLLTDASLRKTLKKAGFLTRDSRMVERKKYGLAGARKRYQFSKR
ncbi:MAG: 30S ribosomal protein S9 [Candidatus Latescibacterota bacterium]